MKYGGRITIVLIFVLIVIAWHSFYFLIDFEMSYTFFFDHGFYIWDFIFIPILAPLFWWFGKQFDMAKFYSEKDALTNAYNRRFVQNIVPKLIAQVGRNGDVLSISIIDIDNFKMINDTYSHLTGDKVLKELAHVLMNNTRKGDVIARWGGDEFLLVTSYERHSSIQMIIHRLEEHLQNISENLQIDVSFSIGTATYPHDGETLESLVREADHKMYTLKFTKKGR